MIECGVFLMLGFFKMNLKIHWQNRLLWMGCLTYIDVITFAKRKTMTFGYDFATSHQVFSFTL